MELARVEGESIDTSLVVRIHGEVDASNAPHIGEQIASMLDEAAAGLVVDLSDTSYLDSAGIRMLLRLRADLDRSGRAAYVAVPADSPITQVLSLTEVQQLMPVVESADRAVELVRRDQS